MPASSARRIIRFDPPDQFIAGAIGEPGQRIFHLQASSQGREPGEAIDRFLRGDGDVLQPGQRFAELFEPNHRRISIPISQVPEHVKAAFIAAEDKRFMTHKGVDERSVIRAFMTSVAATGKRQGGSTITQQVVKNLLVGDDISYERKMREIRERGNVTPNTLNRFYNNQLK
mgnify:CR=1 FL=1